MFDSHTYKGSTTVVTPVTRVVEKGLSPDKVADMYAEVYKEAERNILRKYLVKTNLWEFVVLERLHQARSFEIELVTMIRINGTEVEFTHTVNRSENLSAMQIADVFVKRFGEYIATKCVIERAEIFSSFKPLPLS